MITAKTKIKMEELKTFSEQNVQDLRNLVKQLGSTYQPLTDNDIKQMIDSITTRLIVARDAENMRIIGMGTLAVYRIPYLTKAYLDDFIIDKDYQGQGIGSKLIKTIIQEAEKAGASYLEFTSNPKRVGANKFYQKQRFEKRDTNTYRMTLKHE